MRGCNFACSYCIVPSVRGREVYRPADAILEEIEGRVQRGIKEIVLLGQTVNSYKNRKGWEAKRGSLDSRPAPQPHSGGLGRLESQKDATSFEGGDTASGRGRLRGNDGRVGGEKIEDFSNLLRAVARIEGVERIGFMSPHPRYFSDKLIETMAQTEKICKRVHLPLQSGSDKILKLMRRGYSIEQYKNIIGRLRRAVPGISITTDFIVGFPGETENDFRQTIAIVKKISFNSAYCFKFSPRPGTPAALHDGQVPEKTIKQRHAKLLDIVKRLAQKTQIT